MTTMVVAWFLLNRGEVEEERGGVGGGRSSPAATPARGRSAVGAEGGEGGRRETEVRKKKRDRGRRRGRGLSIESYRESPLPVAAFNSL